MNIVILLEQMASVSGTSVQVAAAARHVALRGHRCRILAFGEIAPSLRYQPAIYQSLGPSLTDLRHGEEAFPSMLEGLIQAAEHESIDIIHAHYPLAMAVAASFAAMRGTATVASLHGYERQLFLSNAAQYRLCRVGLQVASAILPVSAELQNDFIALFPVLADRFTVIPDAVDLPPVLSDRSIPRQARINPPRKRLVFVGRLSREKGVPELLEAFQELHREDPSYDLQIVGDGQLAEHVRQLAAEPELRQVLHWHGSLEHEDVFTVLQTADALVLPSHQEALGSVLIEAMLSGLLPLGTAVGGIPELIEDGVTGLLIPGLQAADIVQTVRRAFSSDEELLKLRQGAWQRGQLYRWDRRAEELLQVYEAARERESASFQKVEAELRESFDLERYQPWAKHFDLKPKASLRDELK